MVLTDMTPLADGPVWQVAGVWVASQSLSLSSVLLQGRVNFGICERSLNKTQHNVPPSVAERKESLLEFFYSFNIVAA